MKNKVYLFLLLCCLGNFSFANTDKHLPNEANPSLIDLTETNTSNIEDFFTDPVINCPSNITVTTAPGQSTKSVSWNAPTATTPCVVSTGQTCGPNSISGFKYLGKYGDSKYYCSATNDFTYSQAKQKAANSGGFLANICSSNVNHFLTSSLLANEAWIGLNDRSNEGHFRWDSGSTCSYRNWASGEPNDGHNTNEYHGADNVVLTRHDGKWRDRNGNARYEFIMEIPCSDGTRPGNVTVAQSAGPGSGSAFGIGSTTIRYTATDECGRTKSCSFTVTVRDGGPIDLCANQGGDSDGDGVCDNQDNCRFTSNPDQADNDGDGIGNVCDDTPNGNPCANQGGDSDGDGVCDNQDNCRFTSNPDQADNDGDGIGNVCDDTPNGGGNGGDCNSVMVVGESGKVTITNIPSNAKIEISGPSTGYGQQLVCNANCGDMEMVSSLSAGNYNVTVQTFNPYCYKLFSVSVTGGGGNPCDGQGGDSDGDGVCDNQDNCDFTSNPDQADNDGDGIGNVCDDTPNGGGTGGGDCNSVTVLGESGKVTISNIPSDAKVEISGPSTGYGQQLVCEGGNCGSMEMVSGLSAGHYNVTIQTFNPYCYNLVSIEVTGGGGNPCDGQGGDSDGDGVCDNQDNCDFTSNPDQADNDGDGIGNVCDDTPNGGGTGGGDCNSVDVVGADGKVNISNIPGGAKIEISGPSTGWGQQLVCNSDCGSSQMVSGLAEGNYNVTVQTFNPYCYKRYSVAVTGGGGGNPCDGQGGDSDGDGICDNQDNCDFTSNPDQADNDGDGIGNVCDDTPNGGGGGGGDCTSVTVAGADGKVNITDIPGGAKIEISGPSTGWGQQLVCNSDCGSSQMVSGLAAGNYNVTVQTFNPYCYKQYSVTVTGGGGGNPCDGQGGDSDGDGICDNQDNCDFTSNPDQADNDGDGIGNVCDDTPNGGGGGGADCNDLVVSGEDGKVNLSNIPSGAKIEISGPSTGYGQQLVCNGDCGDSRMVTGLTAGNYNVTIQTFNPYCYNLVSVTVSGNTDPCASQGGDSDGDGVCDNDDNCKFTWNPDQADNDEDGIGNVCDDTPNGDPCGLLGGDSDGDGVCDMQDNCKFTSNPDQADNDGDGIGNVCDDTPNGGPTVCADRTVSNTNLCQGTNQGTRYGGYLLLDRMGDDHYISSNFYDFQNGKFVEYSDGTARLTGQWVNRGRSSVKFDVDFQFSGRTTNEHGKDHTCLDNYRAGLYYYTNFSGTLTGQDKMAGAKLSITRKGEAFQVGIGANITHNQLTMGASGWIMASIDRQPSTGVSIYVRTGNTGQNGDININLSGAANACIGAGSRTANLSFAAFGAEREVALQWATNSTYRNDYYVIEKSADGESFEELAMVDNTTFGGDMEAFTEVDATPLLGDNYYRVKQVYMDGTFDYTSTELVNFNIDLEKLDVYPNPVTDALFINMKPFIGKKAHILLTNQYGQIVREVKIDELSAAPVRIDVANMSNGMYMLTIQPGNGLKFITKKVVVGKMY